MEVNYTALPSGQHNGILISVILVTNRGLGILAPAIQCLREQTLAAKMELLIVARSGIATVDQLAGLRGFAAVGLVSLEVVGRRGRAAAYAVPFAKGRFVALQENHNFGKPDMYERLVESLADSTAAVSPSVRPANPDNLWGLALYVLVYGHCAPPLHPQWQTLFPHHSSMYRREVLERFIDHLPSLLEREDDLHKALADNGLRMRVSPDATTFHLNEGRWIKCCSDPLSIARCFAASRARDWSLSRRVLYACLFPAIVGLHLSRLVRTTRRLDETHDKLFQLIPRLFVIATLFSVGEVAGYLTRSSKLSEAFEDHEFHVIGRLAGRPIQDPRVQRLLGLLPADAR